MNERMVWTSHFSAQISCEWGWIKLNSKWIQMLENQIQCCRMNLNVEEWITMFKNE